MRGIRRLSATDFARFGAVLEAGWGRERRINEGRGSRFDATPPLEHEAPATRPTLAIYEIDGSALPFRATLLERHPWSAQVFIAMTAERFLVAAALPGADGRPDPESLEAFEGRRGQALVYAPGVWHLPLVALGAGGSFAMFMWSREDGGEDDEFAELAEPIEIG
jgi:ureidoglycolate lyase